MSDQKTRAFSAKQKALSAETRAEWDQFNLKPAQPLQAATLARRDLLKLSGACLVAIPLIPVAGLVGCAADDESTADDDSTEVSDTDTTTTDTITDSTATGSWATGGTAALTVAKANPFSGSLGTVCDLTSATTEGPCYASTLEREDISEGRDGLPVRLCFKIVDANCEPVVGAVVDIWHCDPFGIYSGDDMPAVDFCTGGDEEYMSNDWFRGTQTTDSEGLVYFSTCFPGWYSSRAVHIHLTISQGSQALTTQIGFDDDLVNAIMLAEPVYASRGLPDTSNTTDTVFPAYAYEQFMATTSQQTDGSMLAWKAFTVDLS